ncbi:hypothetical protein NQ317_017326 [Molorchus minor]|uniref:GON domain-containing protein n=1 Tax=Molorchus minor TaxID=1323400 RepID=A0ABQ9K1Z1_9CUCU|nr:hypothetical protein NQ317_017326 [Molorchus minor]
MEEQLHQDQQGVFYKVRVVAHYSMIKYHGREEDLIHYILTLMSHDISITDSCNTLGVADVGSMCTASGCAIIRDTGLSTSYTIAHEIGHVLSMPHDGDKHCEQYNRGLKQNYIMNKMLTNDTKPFMWSPSTLWTLVVHYGLQIEGCKTQSSPWAEGTRCGPNSWCFQRKCVPENREEFTPIDGGWGPWQEFGPCSRTCGGESVRYASCNTEDCEAGSEDARAVQCAAFNGININITNLTNSVKWIPKYGLENADDYCRLYCRPEGSPSHYLLKDKVIDGTKCGLTSFDICINGICRSGGCDNKLESKMALDDCGICGGDNSHCQEISGTYNKPAESSGYNKVLRIPRGSSNLNITQDSYSYTTDDNYLVLIDGETEYPILNGNYTVATHITDIVFGSLILTYSGTNNSVERITTPKNHKLTKDLVVAVLSVGKLTPPHISYRYVIRKDEAPSYGWRLYQKQWSKCSSICEGKQYRKPVCVELTTGNEVSSNYCNVMDESVIQKQECNTHCELTWNIASKGACSVPCGKGIRPVYYNCMKVYKKKPIHSEIVHEKHCTILSEPPRLEACNIVCNSTRWDYTSWSQCTKTCGGGTQRRTAKCVDNSYRPIEDSYCNMSEKITEQICNTERCPSWVWARESPCSTPCGSHVMKKACSRWVPLDVYHMCSVTCGEGVEMRKYACKKFNSEDILDDVYCRDLSVPNESRVCYRGSCDNPATHKRRHNMNDDYDNSVIPEHYDRYRTFQWKPKEWSSCTQTCEGGISIQIFHCVNELGDNDDKMCDPNQKPTNTIQCNNKPCPKWKIGGWSPNCDTNCEKQRQVRCMDYTNSILEDNHCDISRRPEKSTKCKLSECSHVTNMIPRTYFDSKEKGNRYRWKTSPWKQMAAKCLVSHCGDKYIWKVEPWKECSHKCGKKGKQTRTINCLNVRTGQKAARHFCHNSLKPSKRRKCNQWKCLYKSCKEIKHYMKTKENDEYIISIGGRPVKIYCYKMDTPEPQEYVSLHQDTNYAEFYDRRLININSCPYNGQRRDNCHCDHVGTDRSGLTNFLESQTEYYIYENYCLLARGDDFTFSRQIKGYPIPYGTAGDCYSSVQGCAQGKFSINLEDTSFKLSENVRWEKIGSHASSQIHKTVNGASGKCGGYCGNCMPDANIGLAVQIT